MKYRIDIDGLRAIAVAAIVLFHVNPTVFPGGFIGVDVFFAISGFLITASIRQQLEASTFSLWEFYARRIRRLFPALFVSLAGAGALAYLFLLPAELMEFSKSALATVTYVSNVFFYTRTAYFDPAADSTVLLHTWSLSVEEQFYLLFPAFLIFLRHRSRRSVIAALLIAAIVSLLLSEALVRLDSPAAFFLSPSRFWQFLLGGVAAMAVTALHMGPVQKQLVAAAGLVGLAVCLATFRTDRPFPGFGAIAPTLATCLILYGGSSGTGLPHRALSLQPLQWLGRWSYSIYLWHWQTIVFFRLAVNPTPTPTEQALLALASVGLGAVSYYLVEVPTRRVRIDRPKALIGGSLLVTACIAAVASVSILDGGMPRRFSPEQIELAGYLKYNNPGFGANGCFLSSRNSSVEEFRESDCIQPPDGRKRLLIIGDSHAAHYRSMLSKSFPEYSISQATASGCRPLSPTTGPEPCTALIQRAASQYIPEKEFDLVLISARWVPSDADRLTRFIQELGSGPRIVVLGPSAEYVVPLPRLLVQASLNGSPDVVERSSNYDEAVRIDAAIREAVAATTATYFSTIDVQCPEQRCIASSPKGVPYLFDKNHFTRDGATLILASLRQALEPSAQRVSADNNR